MSTQRGMQAMQEGRKGRGKKEGRAGGGKDHSLESCSATPKKDPVILSSVWISNNPTMVIIIHK